MMKQKILLVAALALAGAAIPFEKVDIRGISAADAAFGEDCAENFVSFFSDAYAMECKIDSSAFTIMGMNYSYTIKEEVSSIARSSDISVTLANESMQIGYDYVVADAEGDAYRRSLKVDNSTVDTAIVDSNSENISFLDPDFPRSCEHLEGTRPLPFRHHRLQLRQPVACREVRRPPLQDGRGGQSDRAFLQEG